MLSPIPIDEPALTPAAPAPHRVSGPLRVLVVDDELLIRWSVAQTLAAAGHQTFEASDGGSARQLLASLDVPLDAILLDYRLPDTDDLSLLADLRRAAPDTAVVMMTAYGSANLDEEARRLGAYAVIQKPFDVGRVERLVRDACRRGPLA